MPTRKVLITGGAGFIGGHIAEAYIANGDRVWIIDDLSTGRTENIPHGAEFVRASINDAAVPELFDKVGGFDIVSHHAAQIDVRKSVEDPRFDARVNLDGFLNVVEAALRTRVRRFIFVSSGGVVYGEPEVRPTPETAAKQPLSPYGVSKLAAEYYLHYYHRIHGLDYVAVRYSNVYGPRQDPHGEAGVVAIFSTRLIEQKPLTVYGNGEQTRDYVFVKDVVAANMILSDADLPNDGEPDHRAFNVGTGIETSVVQLAQSLGRAAGIEPEIAHADARPGEVMNSSLDASKLRSAGWQPAHTLEEGLRATYEYIRKAEQG
jgi:UDP-glucose 4-epimerase